MSEEALEHGSRSRERRTPLGWKKAKRTRRVRGKDLDKEERDPYLIRLVDLSGLKMAGEEEEREEKVSRRVESTSVRAHVLFMKSGHSVGLRRWFEEVEGRIGQCQSKCGKRFQFSVVAAFDEKKQQRRGNGVDHLTEGRQAEKRRLRFWGNRRRTSEVDLQRSEGRRAARRASVWISKNLEIDELTKLETVGMRRSVLVTECQPRVSDLTEVVFLRSENGETRV